MKKWTYHSEDSKKKMSVAMEWKINWNKGKKWIYSEKSKQKMSESAKKRWNNQPIEFRKEKSSSWQSEKNPRFKPIWTRKDNWHGYILIKVATWLWFRNWEFEHIVNMEKHIWRKINKKIECVHHVDYVKHNNNIDNLKLMTIREHKKFHLKDNLQKDR